MLSCTQNCQVHGRSDTTVHGRVDGEVARVSFIPWVNGPN